MEEFVVSILFAFLAVAYLFYPLFSPGADDSGQTPIASTASERRRTELLAELEFEFQAGKITKEGYDAAKAEIESL